MLSSYNEPHATMETASYLPPLGWTSYERRLPECVIEYNRRQEGWAELQDSSYSASDTDSEESFNLPWYREIHQVEELCDEFADEEVLELVGSILCQAISIPRDCTRPLLDLEKHHLFFFTNQRVIQIYCAHNINEKLQLDSLYLADLEYKEGKDDGLLSEDETYEAITGDAFATVKPYLAWECLYPEGIDMAALSPLDINANLRSRPATQKEKTKGWAAKVTQREKEHSPPSSGAKVSSREKDHPPPPPAEVREPPSFDRKNGAVYKTRELLGKGGFAICHVGVLAGTRQKYALKIVKSVMQEKRMYQKVRI